MVAMMRADRMDLKYNYKIINDDGGWLVVIVVVFCGGGGGDDLICCCFFFYFTSKVDLLIWTIDDIYGWMMI